MSNWKPKRGDRITWRGKTGIIIDDYWAERDRFTIRLDEGGDSDHGAESLRPEVSGVQHSPRTILAKAYRDNGDIGAANYIEGGHDLLPDTQVHLLAIQDALALNATATPGALDSATVERCAEHLDERADNRAIAAGEARAEGDIEDAVTHARIGNALRSAAVAIRNLATDPHQHGGGHGQ